MGSDYYYDFGRGDGGRRDRRSLAMLLLDALMTLLTSVVAAAGILALVVPRVPPAYLGALPVLALVAQWIFPAAAALMLYWIIRWRWWRAGAMILLVAAGTPDVSRYYKPELRRSYGEPRYDRSAIRVMSFNVRCFYSDDGKELTLDSVASLVRRFNPDIACFQEFVIHSKYTRGHVDSLLGMHGTVVGSGGDKYADCGVSPVAIFSRYRMLDSDAVLVHPADSLPPRGKAMWADLLVDGDTVRVFNVHLNSTSINTEDKEYIANYRYMSDTARNRKLCDMVRRLNANTVSRSLHVDSLAQVMAATRGAKILCGDFNDTPMSYAYRRLSEGMQDAFRAEGRGYSHTFRGFYNTLRIDFVMFDRRNFEVLSYDAPDTVELSDHLPVFARAKLLKNRF